jgi:hypothetical protein
MNAKEKQKDDTSQIPAGLNASRLLTVIILTRISVRSDAARETIMSRRKTIFVLRYLLRYFFRFLSNEIIDIKFTLV